MHAEVVAKPILYVWREIVVLFSWSGVKEKKVYVQTEFVFIGEGSGRKNVCMSTEQNSAHRRKRVAERNAYIYRVKNIVYICMYVYKKCVREGVKNIIM